MQTKSLGRYIVVDPSICHGEPTFRGTRILVADVLEQVGNGMVWDAIIEEWRNALTKEAIAEAIRLAREALVAYAPELVASDDAFDRATHYLLKKNAELYERLS